MIGCAFIAMAGAFAPIANYVPIHNVTRFATFDLQLFALSEAMRAPRDVAASTAAYEDASAALSVKAMGRLTGGYRYQYLELLFASYYESDTWADDFTTSAITGTGDAAGWDDAGLRELATKGAAYANVLHYVYALLQEGISWCNQGYDGSDEWDAAWAFFAGSLEGEDGSGSGQSGYALADKRCPQYLTCDAAGLAKTNENSRLAWVAGRDALVASDCLTAEASYQTILAQTTVPLIQGSLREAYEIDPAAGGEDADGAVEIAEGWAFVYPLLPLIHACDPDAAEHIRENMFLNADPIMPDGFDAVKDEFESVYACLGISCDDVNAMYTCGDDGTSACWTKCDDYELAHRDHDHDEEENDESADSSSKKKSTTTSPILIALAVGGWVFAFILVAVIASLCITRDSSTESSTKPRQPVTELTGPGSSTKGEAKEEAPLPQSAAV